MVKAQKMPIYKKIDTSDENTTLKGERDAGKTGFKSSENI